MGMLVLGLGEGGRKDLGRFGSHGGENSSK